MSRVSFEMLLHPELLSNEQLVSIMQERCLKIPEQITRGALLELFHSYCVPYSQRQKSKDSNGVKKEFKAKKRDHCTAYTELACSPTELLSGHFKRVKLLCTELTTKDPHNEYFTDNYKRKEVLTADIPAKKTRKIITWP